MKKYFEKFTRIVKIGYAYINRQRSKFGVPPATFSSAWYMQRYPDVAQSGMDAWSHYCHIGWKEGRDPTPDFSTNFYLAENADVKMENINPFLHYENYGRREGRRPKPEASPTSEYSTKEEYLDQCKLRLSKFLADYQGIEFPKSNAPLVSIILVLYNKAELTLECLKSIEALEFSNYEVIIYDNASSDSTRTLLEKIENVKIIEGSENIHYLRAVNKATSCAQGQFILLLNNDAVMDPKALYYAYERMEEHDIGAVGGKILLLNGFLQEAGSIIWADGSCLGYGRGDNPKSYCYEFSRDVDYCSAAFLLVRRSLFEQLGRFDEVYVPAYYEETDLCMRIRDLNYRVVYDPRVVVRHFEFGSSSKQKEALELQTKNKAIFVKKHEKTLNHAHFRNKSVNILLARMRVPTNFRGRVLVIDDQIPDPLKGAGFPRANRIVRVLHEAGWLVTVYPLNVSQFSVERARAILPLEVEIVSNYGRARVFDFLKERKYYFDVILISRPHNMKYLKKFLAGRKRSGQSPVIVYDAEAIFAEREMIADAVLGKIRLFKRSSSVERELRLADGADCIWSVSEYEAQKFRSFGFKNVIVIGHAIKLCLTSENFEERANFLFVGAMDDDQSPNVDSISWFVNDVMPHLDRLIGNSYHLDLVGSANSAIIQGLKSSRIRVHGRVEDIRRFYGSSRVFLAPTRYAAGVPHKVHEAAAAGLPVVCTQLIAKQLGWRQGFEILCAEDAIGYAEQCARLYLDQALWTSIREGSANAVTNDCDPNEFKRRILESLQVAQQHNSEAD